MRTRIQKWGNSLAIRIPKPYAIEAGLDKRAIVDISIVDGQIVLKPIVENNITLEQLLEQVTDANLHTEVQTDLAVGHEFW